MPLKDPLMAQIAALLAETDGQDDPARRSPPDPEEERCPGRGRLADRSPAHDPNQGGRNDRQRDRHDP